MPKIKSCICYWFLKLLQFFAITTAFSWNQYRPCQTRWLKKIYFLCSFISLQLCTLSTNSIALGEVIIEKKKTKTRNDRTKWKQLHKWLNYYYYKFSAQNIQTNGRYTKIGWPILNRRQMKYDLEIGPFISYISKFYGWLIGHCICFEVVRCIEPKVSNLIL